MADMQMKLLRKKIQKRNEKNKKRQLTLKQTEEEDTGMSLKRIFTVCWSASLLWASGKLLHARLMASS